MSDVRSVHLKMTVGGCALNLQLPRRLLGAAGHLNLVLDRMIHKFSKKNLNGKLKRKEIIASYSSKF